MQDTEIGRGSGGNVIAAMASLVIPGLGQLAQGRIFSALLQLVGFRNALGLILWAARVVRSPSGGVGRGALEGAPFVMG